MSFTVPEPNSFRDMSARTFQILSRPNFTKKYSCILLNGPTKAGHLTENQRRFWQQANQRVVVDGGFNILTAGQRRDASIKHPEFVYLGDSDSVTDTTFQNSSNQSSSTPARVICNTNQDLTDFDKCLTDLGQQLDEKILVLTWSSITRFDHLINIFSVLNKHSAHQVEVLFHNESESCVTYLFCLPKTGRHQVLYQNDDSGEKFGKDPAKCGIFSLSTDSGLAETLGLRWNLDFGHRLGFGVNAFQSTSNEAVSDKLTIRVGPDENLFFSTVIPDR